MNFLTMLAFGFNRNQCSQESSTTIEAKPSESESKQMRGATLTVSEDVNPQNEIQATIPDITESKSKSKSKSKTEPVMNSFNENDLENKNTDPPQKTDADISTLPETTKTDAELARIGYEGGAWTAQTHLAKYGFNVDWGLLEVLESSCRDIENSRVPEGEDKWKQYSNEDPDHSLTDWWIAPKSKYVDCKVLEIGCGVGVYVDAFKKENAKKKRQVIGIEPNEMGGTFARGKEGPKQLAINFLDADDPGIYAHQIRNDELGGEAFDLIYSIEVMEHIPPERHEDAVKFLVGSARKGTKLIFGAAHPGQVGVGHIGNRKTTEWVKLMEKHGFVMNHEETAKAQRQMQEFNHRVNTRIYYYRGN